jgi:hypothetical protein
VIKGPFPERHPELRQEGWREYDVYGPVRAVIYSTLSYDDPLVQGTLKEYFRIAVERAMVTNDPTPISSMQIGKTSEAVGKLRTIKKDSGRFPKA